jgi:alcohol dehydrogenase class IV
LFTDKGIRAAGLLERPVSILKEMGVETIIFDDLATEPTVDQAAQAIEKFRLAKADFIIAVGGGSVMDIAKLASVLDTEAYTIYDLLEKPLLAQKTVKTLMIPTTAGTGSEATPNSIVTVPERQLKIGIVNQKMIADYVILDAEMIRRLPRHIAASTGLDALAHAIECYTSNKATPFSDMVALEALRLIFNNIESACGEEENLAAKAAMLTASFFAGVAISAAGTTAVHALSYPLGGKYHIPHGVSNAMLLAPVMKFNEPACRDRLANVYDAVNPQQPATNGEKSAWVIARLEDIITKLDIPTDVGRFGVGREALDDLVEAGMQVKRLLDNNLRVVTPEDARKIYLEILPKE